jgi:hypothetical protein
VTPKLGRNSGTITLGTTNATQILGPNMNRWSLTVSILDTAAAILSVDFAENTVAGRGVVVNSLAGPFTFTHADFG